MAGVITNIIKTLFTSSGADEVAGAADKVGRAQTRLGQASAGAGRQFAAQSSGLGGLVGAYAGAAATSFALQAAFTALSSAAAAENIVKGTNALAAATGQQGPKILKSIQDITQGQLSLADAAQQVNIALSAGFSTTQIEKLSEVALKTSRALGRDLADSMQRLVRGTAKLEPELLDELGIFVRIESAVKAYAKQNGVAAASLTEFERRQAFANAAIAEGDRKFSDINTSAPSAQKSLAQLQAQLSNLATEVTQLVANVLTPFVNFISKDFGNLFVLFGGVFLLVFKKAATIFGEFTSSTTSGWIAWADNKVLQNERVKGSFEAATAAAQKLKLEIDSPARGGILGKAGLTAPDGTALLEKSGKMGQSGIPAKLGQEASAIRTKFLKGEALSTAELTRATSVLTDITTGSTSALGANGNALNVQGRQLARNTIAYKDATLILSAYNTALNNTSRTTKLVNASTALFSRALTVLGTIASKMLGFFSWIFIISSALDLLGFDVFGTIGDWFTSMTTKSEEFNSGVTGAFISAAGGAKIFEDSLKRAGATQKELEGANDALLDLYDTVRSGAASSRANTILNLTETTGVGSIKEAQAEVDNILTNIAQYDIDYGKGAGLESFEQELNAAIGVLDEWKAATTGYLTQAELLVQANDGLSAAQAQLNSEGLLPSKESLMNVEFWKALVAGLEKYDAGVLTLIGTISRVTGLDTTAVSEIIGDTTLKNINQGTTSLQLFGMTIQRLANGDFSFDSLTASQKELVGVSFSATFAINEANKAYAAGTTSAEKLGGVIAGIRGQFVNSEKALADYTSELVTNGLSVSEAQKAGDAYFVGLKTQVDILTELKELLQGYDAQIKGISSSFSKDIKILDTLTFDGLINSAGRFATSQTEITKNQNDLILNTLNANKALSDSYDAVTVGFLKQPANMQELVAGSELYNITLKAAAGQLINSVIALEDINKQQLKNLQTAKDQLEITKQELAIQKTQAEFGLQQARDEANISAMQGQIDIAKDLLSLDESRLALALQQLTAVDSMMKKIKDGSAKDINGALAGRQKSAIDALSTLSISVPTRKMGEAIDAYTKGINKALDRQSAIIAIEKVFREDFNRKQLENFDAETRLLVQQSFNAEAKNMMDKAILTKQAELDKARLESQKAVITAEAAIVQAQIDGYASMAQIVDGFGGHIKALGDILGQALTASGIANTVSGSAVVTGLQADISAKAATATATLNSATEAQTANIDAQITSVGQLTKLELDRLEVQRLAIVQQRDDLIAQRLAQRGKLTVEQETELAGLDNKLADLTTTAAGSGEAAEKLTGRLADLKSAIDSSVNSALMGINDAIINGTEENKTALEVLRDAIGSIFISIQEEVYKQTIANPISDMISSWLVGGIKQLNLTDIRGSSLAGVLGSARGAVGKDALAKNIMGDNAVDAGAEAFKKAGEKIKNGISSLGTGVNAAAGAGASAVSNAAGVLASTTTASTGVVATANTAGATTLMSSLGPILAVLAVIAAIMALFGGKKGGASKSSVAAEERAKALAQSNTNTFGAIPRMASGGMMRDRVPALLEPGEFVIRKPIARKIGASNLAQMNATGNTGSTSAPTINIKNEGSPKTAEASPPRFDGEKYVIDVIMRDLSTNGPIRRTLRGGAL
jgi:hypothetical protein